MEHRIAGLPPTDLMSYLVGLGLGRVLSLQAPGSTEWAWHGDTLVINSEVTDIPSFLVDQYRPTPVLSPWNNGSGYAPQDKNQRDTLNRLLDAGDRVSEMRQADAIARELVAQQTSANWTKNRAAKERFILELRNKWPDRALDWLDAAVILTTEGAEFPPLLGSGGNDGRLDFSTNFHSQLLNVIPETGASRKKSLQWATELRDGVHNGSLVRRAVGQFDASGAGTPRSGAFGSGRNLVNPWGFVLMLEGTLLFAAAPARRLGETYGRAALPFTVFGSPDGPAPASPVEDFRGELWAPVWSTPSRLDEVQQVFSEARATWDGSTAVRAAQMYGAVRSFGADRRIDRFIRFGLIKRNGLAYIAVPLDDVRTGAAPGIELAIPAMRRARTLGSVSTRALDQAQRHFESRLTEYLRRTRPEDLLPLLEALTRWELAASKSHAAHEKGLQFRQSISASEAMAHLTPLVVELPELRLAASLASGVTKATDGWTSTRRLVMGNIPGPLGKDWAEATIAGLGMRPLIDVLCDAAVWCDQHGAESATQDGQTGRGIRVAQKHDYWCHWTDVHAWARGELDEDLLEQSFLAYLAVLPLTRNEKLPAMPGWAGSPPLMPVPELALLQALNSGDVRVSGESADAPVQGLRPGWLLRLRAGRSKEVVKEAAALLNRSHLVHHSRDSENHLSRQAHAMMPIVTVDGRRLAAALMASSSSAPANRLLTSEVADPTHSPVIDA